MKVAIYTDGGADPNPGIGGWAAILQAGKHEKVLTGNESWTTNNRMELQAAIAALEALKRPSEVDFYTDSEYLKLGITKHIDNWERKGWKRKGDDIPNKELWLRLQALTADHDITWHWIRGHSGNPQNERVDRLARQARAAISPDLVFPEGEVRLFVRGACKGNPGPGGWGVVIEEGDETRQFSGSVKSTTNNRMELLAVIEGLRLIEPDIPVQIVTTSDYVYQGATRWIHGWRRRNWKKKDGKQISNLDLWTELDQFLNSREIRWLSFKSKHKDHKSGLQEAAELARLGLLDFD